MFESLTTKLGSTLDALMGRGSLKPADVDAALAEVRAALLEADAALPVVKDFIEKVRAEAQGEKVLRAVKPGQQVVKIVHDALVGMLDHAEAALNLNATPPAVILMAGLQGSGKTTTSAKLAKFLKDRKGRKVLLASLDVYRPAAQEQLAILAPQAGAGSLPIVTGEKPLDIAARALKAAKLEGYDVLILDSAGRLSIDDALMDELAAVRDLAQPVETLLIADAMTGQDAVTTAQNFNTRIGVTGIVLTRVDGDARGGAALSMRAVTGRPVKFLGAGEGVEALDVFDARRVAGRILDKGDIVSLVEQAAARLDIEEAKKAAAKMAKGRLDFDDLLSQLRQMQRMGGLSGLLNFMPGAGKIKAAMQGAPIDDKILKRQEAIILSMTKAERAEPDLLNASRRRRIAAGAGVQVQDVNRLAKQLQDMQTVMKRMQKMGGKGMMRGLGLGGGDMAELEEMARNMQAASGETGALGENPFAAGSAAPSPQNLLGALMKGKG